MKILSNLLNIPSYPTGELFGCYKIKLLRYTPLNGTSLPVLNDNTTNNQPIPNKTLMFAYILLIVMQHQALVMLLLMVA